MRFLIWILAFGWYVLFFVSFYDFVFLINSRRLCLSSRWNRAWNVHCQSRRVSSCWQEGSTTSETFRRSTFWRNKYSWHKRDWKSSDCFRSFGRILRSFPTIEGWSRGGPRVLPRGERTTGENRSADVRETAERENESKSRKWRLGQGSVKLVERKISRASRHCFKPTSFCLFVEGKLILLWSCQTFKYTTSSPCLSALKPVAK